MRSFLPPVLAVLFLTTYRTHSVYVCVRVCVLHIHIENSEGLLFGSREEGWVIKEQTWPWRSIRKGRKVIWTKLRSNRAETKVTRPS